MRVEANSLVAAGSRSVPARLERGATLEGSPEAESSLASTLTSLLGKKVQETDEAIQAADKAAGDLVVGRTGDIHGTMLALERADMQFRMLTAVRNKAIDAYKEVMRMNL